MHSTWDVWADHGNMVSASVFFILRQLRRSAAPQEGVLGVMLAVGTGVSCEMALLRSGGWLSAGQGTA